MNRRLGWLLLTLPAWRAAAGEQTLLEDVRRLCGSYVAGFGSPATDLCYHHRLDGPRGLGVLASPEEIRQGLVHGRPMPYGYGSGIQDVALENGQLLMALCDAHEATSDDELAALARRTFHGLRRLAEVSPEPGFVPRGPHPDGRSYYPDSSRDQHCAYVEALWRYARSPLATPDDRAFISRVLGDVAKRMERYDWSIRVEDGSRQAHVGFAWSQWTVIGAVTLLSHLAAVHEATGDAHWAELYERFGAEQDGRRWSLIRLGEGTGEQPETLYSNQFFTSLRVLLATEHDPDRLARLRSYARERAARALGSDVFDETRWRRLDWAGQATAEEQARWLAPFGLRLDRPTTVSELLAQFDPDRMSDPSAEVVRVDNKLLFGLPTVAYHMALLAGDADLVAEAAPGVRRMVATMLQDGRRYQGGENFSRAVVLGLELLAQSGGPAQD